MDCIFFSLFVFLSGSDFLVQTRLRLHPMFCIQSGSSCVQMVDGGLPARHVCWPRSTPPVVKKLPRISLSHACNPDSHWEIGKSTRTSCFGTMYAWCLNVSSAERRPEAGETAWVWGTHRICFYFSSSVQSASPTVSFTRTTGFWSVCSIGLMLFSVHEAF